MPVFNPDYFTDALIECLMKENDSRTLGKYKLSGREALQAVINYFSKAKFVEIKKDHISADVQMGRKTRSHSISYQFSVINLIMNVLASSIEEFGIECCPKDFNAIEYFLNDHEIKKVSVHQDLPQKYRTLIASCYFIEKVTVSLFCWTQSPFNMIPNTCRELKFTWFYSPYINKLMKLSTEYIKNIEKLEIEAMKYFPKRYTSSS